MKIQVDSNGKPYIANGKALIAGDSTTKHMYVSSRTGIQTGDLVIDDIGSGSGGIIDISTDAEMETLHTIENLGNVYRFTGTSTIYTTDDIYVVERTSSGSSSCALRHYTKGGLDAFWSYNVSLLQNGNVTSNSGWLTSPFIAIEPTGSAHSIKYQSQNSVTNAMIIEYNSSKAYVDYWSTASSTNIGTYDGYIVYQRTISSKSTTAYVRISIRSGAYEYAKVWNDNVLIFDGSEHTP